MVAGLWQVEKRTILDVECEAPGPAALAPELPVSRHLHGLGVDGGDLILVFQIDVHVTLAVRNGLLGRSAQVERRDDRAIFRVDHRGVWLAVAEYPDALVKRVEQNAVRAALHLDGLDGFEGLGVPHDHRFAAAEAVMVLGVDGGPARAGLGNLTDRCQRIEVVHRDARILAGARDVQPPPGLVRVDIVETTVAADLGGLQHFVRTISGCQHREPCCQGRGGY